MDLSLSLFKQQNNRWQTWILERLRNDNFTIMVLPVLVAENGVSSNYSGVYNSENNQETLARSTSIFPASFKGEQNKNTTFF